MNFIFHSRCRVVGNTVNNSIFSNEPLANELFAWNALIYLAIFKSYSYNDANRVEIWTHPQNLFGEECSVSCLPQPESEDGKIKVLLSETLEEIDIDDLENAAGEEEIIRGRR